MRRWIEDGWISVLYTDASGIRTRYPDHKSPHLAAIYPAEGESGQIELVTGEIYEAVVDIANLPKFVNFPDQNPGPPRGFQNFREAVTEVLRLQGPKLPNSRLLEILKSQKLSEDDWPKKSQRNAIFQELREHVAAEQNAGRPPVGSL